MIDTQADAVGVLKQAEEALVTFELCEPSDIKNALTNLRNLISALEKAEPVAWHGITGDYGFAFLSFHEQPGMTPLYTHPAPAVPDVVELKQQRDELAAALKSVMDMVASGRPDLDTVIKGRAALAKVGADKTGV